MHFAHAPEIWRRFPQLVPGVLVLSNVDARADVTALLPPWHARARERLAAAPESQLPEISAWRRAYAQMGLKPTQYRSAAEALLRRFRRENDLPRVHPLVDVCNALSLAFALPIAAFDIAGIKSHLEVRPAEGGEEHVGFGGEVEHAEPGEVIFADANRHAHARRWTFRQSRLSTVGADSRRVLVVAEGLHATAGADVPALLDALATTVAGVGGAPRHRTVLTAAAPRLEITA
ncbi:MAG TPA: phenylalanine--tRNA ligase beta subunit-related protein [Methylomirabilota bacterium]